MHAISRRSLSFRVVLPVALSAALVLTPAIAYAHGDGTHVMPVDQAPTVAAAVAWDSMNQGINVNIQTDRFTFAPESVGKGYVAGQGHAHLEIDGNDVGRAYAPNVYIPIAAFDAGKHTLTVELEANDHQHYLAGTDEETGEDILTKVEFTIPEGYGMGGASAAAMPNMDMSSQSSSSTSNWLWALGGLVIGSVVTWLATRAFRRPTTDSAAEKSHA